LDGDWNEHQPKLAWRERVGPSWSTMIVVDGHVVTQEQRGDAEVIVCRDAVTGHEIWVHEDKIRFEEKLSGAGPRGTPTFADGRIYALGAKGKLNCLNAQTGEVAWSHDIVADALVEPAEMPEWGYSGSPLLVDDLVVVFAGGTKDKSILAYRADGGELAWTCAGGRQSYSSPQLATLAGQRQIVMHDNVALRGISIADGIQLWEHRNGSELSVPMIQPHQTGSGDLVVSSEPSLGLLKVEHTGDEWTVAPGWTTNRFRPGFNDFVIHEGYLYGLDDGILCSFDLTTGERVWKKGRLGHGQLLLIPEQSELIVSSDSGEIFRVSVSRDGYRELGRFQAIEGKTWNGPVLAGGRLFLRNGEEMAAYEMKPQANPSEPVAVK
jgi:outer membrane protein assembly factor BamB